MEHPGQRHFIAEEDFPFQHILNRFLAIRDRKEGRYNIQMSEGEIIDILQMAKRTFMSQPMLLEIGAPIKVCGDTHGQFSDLLRIFNTAGWPPTSNYLFLGNRINKRLCRPRQASIAVIVLLLLFKIKYHDNLFLLRGNHEAENINRIYGFYDECKRRYSIHLWKVFQDVFNCMPVAALIEEKIFCMHGGISPELRNWDQIRRLPRPCEIPDRGLICDLLWADPANGITGFQQNNRDASYMFGADVVHQFVRMMDIDLICRAHHVVEDGYEYFADRRLVTIFSAPNYCDEFDNAAGIMHVDENLVCRFEILRPAQHGQRPAALYAPMTFIRRAG